MYQSVHFQIFVHPQGVERCSIEACEEHIHNNQKIHFTVLHSHRQILVVVLELIGGRVEVGVERCVVVENCAFKKIAGGLIKRIGVEAFLLQNIFRVVLVCGVAENRGDRKLAVILGELLLKLRIILHCHWNGADGKDGVEACHALALQGVETVAFGFLVEMLQRVFDNLPNTLRRTHSLFNINGRNILVLDVLFFLNRVHIVDTERKNIAVIDGIHNRVSVELVAKGLRRGQQLHVLAFSCIGGENRRAGKTEQMIILERLDNLSVHISELAAVALVKDDNAVLAEHLVSFVFRDKVVQLLDGRDDDLIRMIAAFFVPVLKLSLQYSGRSVAVGRAFFEAVIFLHGLIVQIFSIHHKQNLVHIRKCGCKLRCLEGGQRFTASCGVPDVPSGIQCSHLLVVGGYLDAVQDALGGCNLIGTHNHQNFFRCENTILGQHIQNGVLGKEGFCKINQVGNHLIVAVCPEGSKLKAVAGFLRFLFCRFAHFLDVAVSGGVGVILGMGSIGDNENLHILIQAACRPEAVSLVALDLVKGFTYCNATAFQLHMDKGQTVHQNGHIVAGVMVALAFLVLIDDL